MIKLNFVGDFFAFHPENIIIDDKIKNVLKNSNFNIVNFEGPINSKYPPIKKSGPNICQSKDSIQFLKNLGFNIFTLGNNHSLDYGELGLFETLNKLKDVDAIGANEYERAYSILVKQIYGLKIGFFSLSHYEFGISESIYKNTGVAWINDPAINQLIIKIKPELDYLFILPHAGVENIDIPLPIWRNRYKEFIDLGADAVIGSHPHVPQGVEYYKNKPIFYSLGNFFFEIMNKNIINQAFSIIVSIIIDNNTIKFDYNLIKRSDYYLRKIDKTHSLPFFNHLNNLLLEPQYSNLVKKIVIDLWNKIYKKQLQKSMRKFSLKNGFLFNLKMIAKIILKRKDNLLLLNTYQCESHRWIIQEALKMDI